MTRKKHARRQPSILSSDVDRSSRSSESEHNDSGLEESLEATTQVVTVPQKRARAHSTRKSRKVTSIISMPVLDLTHSF
jgi:hypothetical protein